MDTESKLKEIVANIFSVDSAIVDESFSPEKVDSWDSLQHLNLVLAIEEEFGIKISPEESTELVNFDVIVKHINGKLSQKEKEASA